MKNFSANKDKDILLAENLMMKKYIIEPQTFAHGIAKMTPGSGYLDFYDDKLFILSSRGILGFSENIENEKIEFKQVENNLSLFLNKKQFLKGKKNLNQEFPLRI